MSWAANISPKSMSSGMNVLKKYAKTQYGLDEEEDTSSWSFTDWLKHLYEVSGAKYLLLLLLLMCYASLGGLMFMLIERQPELDALNAAVNGNIERRLDFASNLTVQISALAGLPSLGCDESCLVQVTELLNRQLKLYDDSTGVTDAEKLPNYNWNDFWTTSFYAGTLFTTIGYGNMSCRTKLGKAATILYSLFGIPLMLMVLDHWGKLMFRKVREVWFWFLRMVRGLALRLMSNFDRNGETNTAVDDKELVNKIEDTVPLSLALLVVVFYTFFCAAFFKLWETEWSYFEAFYFFFISLSTIGLGDQVPEHPKYALAAFILFVIGLALVSMCASVMGARIEAQYMAALMMVEQQAAEVVEQERAEIAASLDSPSSPFRLSLPTTLEENEPQEGGRALSPERPGIRSHSPSPARPGVSRRSPSLISHMMTQRQSTNSNVSEHTLPTTLGVIRSSIRTRHPFSAIRNSSSDRQSMPRSPNRRTIHAGSADTTSDASPLPTVVTFKEADEAPMKSRL